MSSERPLVLLFEDDIEKGVEIGKSIRAALGSGIRFERFDWKDNSSNKGAYEDQIASLLDTKAYAGLNLIVTDRDISKSKRFPGLSEAVISKVASRIGVPVCVYAAGRGDSVVERQKSGGDGRIILDPRDLASLGRKVAVLAKGFNELKSSLSRVIASPKKLTAYKGPAAVLADVLGKPDVVGHLSLYASGDQRMISEIMPGGNRKLRLPTAPKLAAILGAWLYDSVLRFPGLLVDHQAAGSFLNIDPEKLLDPDIARVFADAIYDGPFSDRDDPRWWRHLLLDAVEQGRESSGLSLARKRLPKKKIPPCKCSVDGKAPAGFLCVVTWKPVCEKHSVGQISWLPRGADLARVRKDVFDELGPWIGLS